MNILKKVIINKNYFYVKTRDRIGGTIRTDVFKKEDGLFQAHSHYWQDEHQEIGGYAESYHAEQAVALSRKDLRKVWKEEKMLEMKEKAE